MGSSDDCGSIAKKACSEASFWAFSQLSRISEFDFKIEKSEFGARLGSVGVAIHFREKCGVCGARQFAGLISQLCFHESWRFKSK